MVSHQSILRNPKILAGVHTRLDASVVVYGSAEPVLVWIARLYSDGIGRSLARLQVRREILVDCMGDNDCSFFSCGRNSQPLLGQIKFVCLANIEYTALVIPGGILFLLILAEFMT